MPAGLVNSKIEARSQELTKNVVHTSKLLENHFKSIKRREVDFKKQKLVNFEEELKVNARMARPAQGPEAAVRKRSSSPREGEVRGSEARTGPLQRSKPGGNSQASRLARSWSSPDGWPHSSPPQFPDQWGGHCTMPKPPGSPAAFPLAVTRHCADTPACQHPPPHPGSHSMRPAKTRSMAAFATSHTAASSISLAMPPSMTAYPSRVPTTPPSRRPVVADRGPAEEDATFITSTADNTAESASDPMIDRLGHFMALLGPRYKCCSKEKIWEQAMRGERTPAQRRLHKMGGIEAVGGGPSKTTSSSKGDLVALDPDGKARAAWLESRNLERERRNRMARSSAIPVS